MEDVGLSGWCENLNIVGKILRVEMTELEYLKHSSPDTYLIYKTIGWSLDLHSHTIVHEYVPTYCIAKRHHY